MGSMKDCDEYNPWKAAPCGRGMFVAKEGLALPYGRAFKRQIEEIRQGAFFGETAPGDGARSVETPTVDTGQQG